MNWRIWRWVEQIFSDGDLKSILIPSITFLSILILDWYTPYSILPVVFWIPKIDEKLIIFQHCIHRSKSHTQIPWQSNVIISRLRLTVELHAYLLKKVIFSLFVSQYQLLSNLQPLLILRCLDNYWRITLSVWWCDYPLQCTLIFVYLGLSVFRVFWNMVDS